MKRESVLITGMLLVFSSILFAQDGSQPSPALPSDPLGPQLVVWSQLQKPKPVPQPLPPPEVPGQQQPDPQSGLPPNPQAQQQPAAQSFTGTIVKDAGKYVLKTSSDRAYQLDKQEMVREYEGKQVRLVGTLAADGQTVRVVRIELMS